VFLLLIARGEARARFQKYTRLRAGQFQFDRADAGNQWGGGDARVRYPPLGDQRVDESLGISESESPHVAVSAGKKFYRARRRKRLRHRYFRVLCRAFPLSRYDGKKICVRIVRVALALKSTEQRSAAGLRCDKSSKFVRNRIF
jgi:hypothetical protein